MALRSILPALGLALALGAPVAPLSAQQPTDPTEPTEPAEAGEPAAAAPSEGPAEGTPPAAAEPAAPPPAPPREGFLPTLDVYFPEGDLDLRTSRLINKVFFEGQVKYNFVDGDITAFLRYRYYGFQRTYQITGFDAVEFDSVEELSGEFDRVRGLLVLTEWPHDYHRRSFLLTQLDRFTSNKPSQRFVNNQTNTYLRFGYQIGTPDDQRSNSIVGETRAQVDRLFTAYRDIGPGDFGLTTAATYSADFLGDFDYVKLEFEGLKRFELGRDIFVVGRLHGGTFPHKSRVREVEEGEVFIDDSFSIPRSELLRLDGRTRLKGLSERRRGTEQVDTTWELFTPWFLDRDIRALGLTWKSWYWVLYGGYGTTGFDSGVYTDLGEYFPDVGIGFESVMSLRKYRFFLSGIVAQALEGDGGLEASLSIKSYR